MAIMESVSPLATYTAMPFCSSAPSNTVVNCWLMSETFTLTSLMELAMETSKSKPGREIHIHHMNSSWTGLNQYVITLTNVVAKKNTTCRCQCKGTIATMTVSPIFPLKNWQPNKKWQLRGGKLLISVLHHWASPRRDNGKAAIETTDFGDHKAK